MFSKEWLLTVVKDYRLWIIFAMILFIIYLIFGKPTYHGEVDIQFDQAVKDTITILDTL